MTVVINDVAPRIHYTATAGQTTFTVPFEFLTNGELKVYVNNVLMTYSTPPANASLYHTTGVGVSGGGTVIFGPPGRAASDKVAIYRDIPVARMEELTPTNAQLENTLDAMTAMIQQNEANIAQRTLHLSNADFMNPLNPLPDTEARKNKLLGFDADGQPTAAVQLVGPPGAPGLPGEPGPPGTPGLPGPPGAPSTGEFESATLNGNTTVNGNLAIPGSTVVTGPFEFYKAGEGPTDASPILSGMSQSSSPTYFDELFKIQFNGRNSTGALINYATIKGSISDPEATFETGALYFILPNGGTPTNYREFYQFAVGQFEMSKWDDGPGAGPSIFLTRNSASPLANDKIGSIYFRGTDSGGAAQQYAEIMGIILDPTAASEDGAINFSTQGTTGTNQLVAQLSHLNGSTFYGKVTLESTDAGATALPNLDLYRNSASPAVNDLLGNVRFKGKTSTAAIVDYGTIDAKALTVTNATQTGQLQFKVAAAPTLTIEMTIDKDFTTLFNTLVTKASAAAAAGFRLVPGAAPTTPVNGDVWATSGGVYAQINGATVGPFGTGGATSIDWAGIVGKPSTFPPSAHVHPTSEITGLDATLNGKVDVNGDVMTGDLELDKTGAQTRKLLFTHGTSKRWGLEIGAEDLGDGSDFALNRYDTGGGVASTPLSIERDSGWVHLGDTFMEGKLTARASNTAIASIGVPHGVAPSSPFNGDFWSEAAGFYGRINGETARFATTNTHQQINSTKTFTVPPVFPGSNDDLPSFRMVINGYPLFPEPGWVWMDNDGLYYCVEDGVPIGPLGGGGGASEWDELNNKPSTFPPSPHVHPTSEITGLDASLAAKLPLAGGVMTAGAVLQFTPGGYNGGNNAINWGTAGTGIWSAGTNVVIAIGGTNRLTMSGSSASFAANLRTLDGSVTAPAYSFTNDSNSGFYLAAAGDLRLSMNAVDAWKVLDTDLSTAFYGNIRVGRDTGNAYSELHAGAANGTNYATYASYANNLARWAINLSGYPTETGTGNTGSDFNLFNFNDAGAQIGIAFSIKRSNGAVTATGPVTAPSIILPPATPASPVDGQMWTTASGVHARINGSTMQVSPGWVQLTQAAYDAIGTKDPNMLYVVIG